MIGSVCQLCQHAGSAFNTGVTRSTSNEQTRDLTLGDGCLDFLDALLRSASLPRNRSILKRFAACRFGKVPPESLPEFVGTLCSIPNLDHSRHFDTKMSWHILRQVTEYSQTNSTAADCQTWPGVVEWVWAAYSPDHAGAVGRPVRSAASYT